MSLSALSVHAHFYQPPREDPLTGIIPIESSAAPYHDWNERILAECYRPNAELRNFERISFDIGPTLFNWLIGYDPYIGNLIIQQDRRNQSEFGIGNALAQAYNHTILPLSSRYDKVTQIYWGIADFLHHFGHEPQGMWLPETAVDYETLEILVENNINYTILAPWQAESTQIDTSEPYIATLPCKQQITLFFYQSDVSGRLSFDPFATINADSFAKDVLLSYINQEKKRRGEPQLLLLASDGELYGHHQQLRDRFLARLVDGASRQLGVQPIYPGLWLQSHPARQLISIRERTSWSCHHGVKRWKGSCPCSYTSSTWKARLRKSFDHLATSLDDLYLQLVQPVIPQPWLLRDRYIHVILGEMTLDALLFEMAGRVLTTHQSKRIYLMLEAQRERQRMFTSCGWFFDDFDRIEPANNVAYAAQAVLLARHATGIDLSSEMISYLERVKSNKTQLNAAEVFKRHINSAESLDSQRFVSAI